VDLTACKTHLYTKTTHPTFKHTQYAQQHLQQPSAVAHSHRNTVIATAFVGCALNELALVVMALAKEVVVAAAQQFPQNNNGSSASCFAVTNAVRLAIAHTRKAASTPDEATSTCGFCFVFGVRTA